MNLSIALPPPLSATAASSAVTPSRESSLHRLMLWLVSGVARLGLPGSQITRYGTALAALAVATLLRLLLDPIMESRSPYGFYLIATAFVVWRAGFGPAIVTVCAGVLLGRYLFDAPRGTLALVSEANWISLPMSLSVGMVIAFVCESLRVAAVENARLFQLARQADTRKDEFLATLAHELRNPLVPIRNAVYLLDAEKQNELSMAELHDVIGRQTEHLVRLTNDLLDVSRISRGQIALQLERVELASAFAAALDVIRPLVEEKRQDLQVSLPTDGLALTADPVRLTQILTNLLHNASKYTEREGRLWLSAAAEENQLVVRVRDTGIGLAPEARKRIFNLFEQVHAGIEHSQGGLGIGLTLVRTLVELHGGTVEAKSPGLGLGSEFVVRLPGVSVDETSLAIAAPAVPGPRKVRGLALRILVVDDSFATAKSMAQILKLWNHTVEISSDGFAALEAVRTFRPDVVLADLGMPRMHGYQLAEEIRRLPEMHDVVLIAVSGYGQEADQERSRSAGFVLHLVKPVDPDELKRVLKMAVQPALRSPLATASLVTLSSSSAGVQRTPWTSAELLFMGACALVTVIALGCILYAVLQ